MSEEAEASLQKLGLLSLCGFRSDFVSSALAATTQHMLLALGTLLMLVMHTPSPGLTMKHEVLEA